MNAVLSSPSMPYGAPELQRAARPHMIRALLLSSALVTTAFALALSLRPWYGQPDVRVIDVPIPQYRAESFRIPLPPPLREAPPQASPAPPSVKEAVPVVVEDPRNEVAPPLAHQGTGKDQGADAPVVIGGGPQPGSGVGEGPVNEPGTIAFVERFPVPIRQLKPRYPDLATQANVEGTVMVYVLIGKDGKVQDVKLHPEKHVPMLDAAALEAARAWTFEPALSNGRPVPVWVSVPFKFSLR